jgi:glycosyltransferase involved in cell wall biosynthesis
MSTSRLPDIADVSKASGIGNLAERVRHPERETIPEIHSEPRRPIRVAFVVYRDDLNVGGSLRVVETLANALDPTRVEAHIVFAYGEPGPVASRANVPCHFLGSHGPSDLRGWLRARRTIDEINPDVLHFHNPAYWLHAALAGRSYKKLLHFHGPYFPHRMSWLDRLLMSQTSRLADASVCITRGTRQLALSLGWGEPDRSWTVYNAIDCAHFAELPAKSEARAALNLPQDALVLGVVCRLAWYKGCRDALRVLARLNPRWHLVFCGDGPMQKYLGDVARLEGVSNRTHFTGMLGDMRPAYAAMDAFLFLSKLEPFGLVMAEAMASGVPVFGLGGEGDYREAAYPLITKENSVFVERANPGDYGSPEPNAVLDEIAGHIDRFGEHPESYRSMVDRAHRWAWERFDQRVQADAMFEVYELAMGRPTDSPK